MAEEATKAPSAIRELITSFQKNAHARLTSPFAGSFVFAWLALNWRLPVILLFSSRPLEDRIDAINIANPSTAHLIWWPLLFAFLGLIVYSIASIAFFAAWDYVSAIKSKIGNHFEGGSWTPPAIHIAVKQRLQSEIGHFRSLAADSNTELEKLRDDKRTLEANLASGELEMTNLKAARSKDSQNVIAALERTKGLEETLAKSHRENMLLQRQNDELLVRGQRFDAMVDELKAHLTDVTMDQDPDPKKRFELAIRRPASERQFLSQLLSRFTK